MLYFKIIKSKLIYLALIATFLPAITTSAISSIFNASQLAASQILGEPFPYDFPDQDSVPDLFPMQSCNGIVLEEATIDQLQDYMDHGKLTSSQLVLCYLQRIYQTDNYIKYDSNNFHLP